MATPPTLEPDFDPLLTRLSADDQPVRSYVVRNGRLTLAQKAALQRSYPRYGLAYQPGHLLSSRELLGRDAPFVVEIGFGMGTATAQIAMARPEDLFLGLEVHAPGVGRLLQLIEENGIENIRVCRHDAMEVASTMLDVSSVDAFHIFFPDPWPKKKHHKRRIIRPDFMDLLTSRLRPGGYIYYVTDWEEYAEAALEVLQSRPGLRNRYAGWAERQPWRPVTKFEQRALDEGRVIRELLFERRPAEG